MYPLFYASPPTARYARVEMNLISVPGLWELEQAAEEEDFVEEEDFNIFELEDLDY